MVALNFSPQFAPLVEARDKTQRLEVIEATAAKNHREVMRLKRLLRDRGIIDETLSDETPHQYDHGNVQAGS